MSFAEMVADPLWREELTHRPAADLLHGVLGVEESVDGWSRPRRFFVGQQRALGSCSAWHPGLFRQMSRTSAGVCVEFETNSSEVALELRTPGLSHAVSALTAAFPGADGPDFDGVACEVDGELLPISWGESLPIPRELEEQEIRGGRPGWMERLICFSLVDERRLPEAGVLPLPGFGSNHHVRLWLPCLHEVELRTLWGDGTSIEEVSARKRLLVIGDGVAQGLAGDPACTWPVRLAERLSLDLLNQSIARQVFQPLSLSGLAELGELAAVVVALGEGYRSERGRLREVSLDIRGHLRELSRVCKDVPTWVVLPDVEGADPVAGSCFADVVPLIESTASELGLLSITSSDLGTIEL